MKESMSCQVIRLQVEIKQGNWGHSFSISKAGLRRWKVLHPGRHMFSFYQHSWQISFQKLEAGRYELHVGKKILVRKKSFTLANICFRFIDRRWQIPFLKENLQKILSLKIKKIVFVLTQKRPNTFHCHSVIIQNNLGLKVSHWNFELFSQILFGSNYFWSFQLNFF